MLIHDHYKVFTQRKYSIIAREATPSKYVPEVLGNEIP